jgi:mannose-6-phosphate isomerase-like protein (cupin superfamily)
MGYHVAHADAHEYELWPAVEGDTPRRTLDLTAVLSLTHSRARLWRLAAHTRSFRHRDLVQEEVFAVLAGTLTVLVGDPPERVDLSTGSVLAVEPATALQLRNESDDEVVVLAYGAPPDDDVEFLEDVKL